MKDKQAEIKDFTFKLKAKYVPTILDLMRNQMRTRELNKDERMLKEICEFVETVVGYGLKT